MSTYDYLYVAGVVHRAIGKENNWNVRLLLGVDGDAGNQSGEDGSKKNRGLHRGA